MQDYANSSGERLALKADLISWSAETLRDGDPVEHEDKWGKVNVANYSVKCPKDGFELPQPLQ